ncbi:MAG: hypothetical protein WB771_11480 [Solirubrobacterales bacterium]
MLILLLAATATTLATGLGAIPVFWLGGRASASQPALYGLAAGAMTVASIVGLLKPGFDQGSTAAVVAGVATGVAFLVITRVALGRSHLEVGGRTGPGARLSVLVFLVLLVHSLPEGFSIGTAYASDISGLPYSFGFAAGDARAGRLRPCASGAAWERGATGNSGRGRRRSGHARPQRSARRLARTMTSLSSVPWRPGPAG